MVTPMPDRLILDDLAVQARLGIHDWEREKLQTIWIDVEVEIDALKAAASDDVKDAVDYARLVSVVTQRIERTAYRLMETLAEDVTAFVIEEFRVPRVRVRVKKKALPGIGYAAVEIERTARRGRTRRPAASARRRMAAAEAPL